MGTVFLPGRSAAFPAGEVLGVGRHVHQGRLIRAHPHWGELESLWETAVTALRKAVALEDLILEDVGCPQAGPRLTNPPWLKRNLFKGAL